MINSQTAAPTGPDGWVELRAAAIEHGLLTYDTGSGLGLVVRGSAVEADVLARLLVDHRPQLGASIALVWHAVTRGRVAPAVTVADAGGALSVTVVHERAWATLQARAATSTLSAGDVATVVHESTVSASVTPPRPTYGARADLGPGSPTR